MKKTIRDFLCGLAFGITETLPGISGSTIAIILGFYFELISAINHFSGDVKKNLKFLLPLALGLAAGILIFSSVINFLLTGFSFPTMLFFIGLIAGIIPHFFTRVKNKGRKFNPVDFLLVLIPFAALLIISGLRGITADEPEILINAISIQYMIFIFFAGVLAAAALVIPGFSGSFVMLLLGIYPLVIFCISSLRIFLADVSNTSLLLNICRVLGPLAAGVIAGGLCMVALIEKLLKNHSHTVYSVILGLLCGSVFVLFRNPIVYRSGVSALIIAAGVITFAAGSVIAFTLGRKRL